MVGHACGSCGARTDPLSRQATQNEMGPWFVRDPGFPFRPGCRIETMERWARSGRLTPETVVRGPSTSQNWVPARRAPGLARLFGRCHACEGEVALDEMSCRSCGSHLHAERDRQHLGLSPVRALPGRDDPALVAERLLFNEPRAMARDRSAGMLEPKREGPESGSVSGLGFHADRAVQGTGLGAGSAKGSSDSASGYSPSSREALLERRLASARRRGQLALVGCLGLVLVVAGLITFSVTAGRFPVSGRPEPRGSSSEAVSQGTASNKSSFRPSVQSVGDESGAASEDRIDEPSDAVSSDDADRP